MEHDYLSEIRDKYDKEIMELLIKRMEAVAELTRRESKGEDNTAYPDAETDYMDEFSYLSNVLNSLDSKCRHMNLPETAGMYDENARLEKSLVKKACYQGLPFSYSESAAKALFGHAELMNKTTFEDVFKAVHVGAADVGIVPFENSTAGYINDVYDLILKYDLFINYTYVKKVDHCLAGIPGAEEEDIKEVHSHPQALAQCREYIRNSGYTEVAEINTAVAAQKIAEMNIKEAACICSEEAALHYGLKILRHQINQQKLNYTRFAAVSKKKAVEEDHNRISFVFNVSHTTGSLSKVLSIIAYYGCNLYYINSRPNLKNPWEYMFYLDFEGNLAHKQVKCLLSQLWEEVPFMKVLGSFNV